MIIYLSSIQNAKCSIMYIKQEKKGQNIVNSYYLSYPSKGQIAQSITDIETCPATAVTCCTGVVHNLELAPNQFGSIVHGAAVQQLE